jgi:hypothetical protein
MSDWIDQLDDTELKVFNGQLASFPNDETLDAAIIKWLDSEGRTADVVTMRLHRYIRDSARGDVTGSDFLAFCDENNVEGYAGPEAKARITELRESEDYQAQTLTEGDLSFRMTNWRKEVDNEHHEIWGEWWEAWQDARRSFGLTPQQGAVPAAGQPVTEIADYADTVDLNVAGGDNERAATLESEGHEYEETADLNLVEETPLVQFGQFEGANAWVNSLDANGWAAFSGADHSGLDHDAALRVWANGSGRSDIAADLDLYDYLYSLASTDATTTAPEFLAWYDGGGWSGSADAETKSRVERLRQADAATQADPVQVGSAVHPWRRSLRSQLDGSSETWWAAWQAAQAAGGYAVGVKPAAPPVTAAAAAPAVTLPNQYEDPAAAGGNSGGYVTNLDDLPNVTDEDDEQDEPEEEEGQLPHVQTDEHGYVSNLDALSQVQTPGEIVRGYAEDNSLDKLFEYFKDSDITTVLASVQEVDGGASLDRLASSYPGEFGGWFDAAADAQVQSALLTRPVIAGVIRAHRATTDPRSRQPRKDAAASEPARMKLQPAQLAQIDAANKAAIASIERGGELTWYAGGTAVLIGQDHEAGYLRYYDEQADRVSGTVIVRRIRVGTGPVVFFDVPPAKQEMVASAARRATSRKPVFEAGT